jgi:hypothetical protein
VKEKAAAILEEAKKLWTMVSSRPRKAVAPARASTTEAISAIDVKVEILERQVRQLEEEAAASYEVVNSIAQQHSRLSEQSLELAQALDEQLTANRRLTWISIALGVLVVAALAIAIAR